VHIKVLWVVNVLIRPGLYTVDDAGFQIQQDGARYVAGVIALVEEDILAVTTFRGKGF
jgi:hypothetical protein